MGGTHFVMPARPFGACYNCNLTGPDDFNEIAGALQIPESEWPKTTRRKNRKYDHYWKLPEVAKALKVVECARKRLIVDGDKPLVDLSNYTWIDASQEQTSGAHYLTDWKEGWATAPDGTKLQQSSLRTVGCITLYEVDRDGNILKAHDGRKFIRCNLIAWEIDELIVFLRQALADKSEVELHY